MTSEFLKNFLKIILGTPWWVWLIFAYVMYVGTKAMKRHVVYLPRLFIIPAILIGMKIDAFYAHSFNIFLVYTMALFLGVFIGMHLFDSIKARAKGRLFIDIPGSILPLLFLMLFFAVKYTFVFLKQTEPLFSKKYLFLEFASSSILSGCFLGRTFAFLKKYFKTRKR